MLEMRGEWHARREESVILEEEEVLRAREEIYETQSKIAASTDRGRAGGRTDRQRRDENNAPPRQS